MERIQFTDYLRALIERYHREHPQTRNLVLPLESPVRVHVPEVAVKPEGLKLSEFAQDCLRLCFVPHMPASVS